MGFKLKFEDLQRLNDFCELSYYESLDDMLEDIKRFSRIVVEKETCIDYAEITKTSVYLDIKKGVEIDKIVSDQNEHGKWIIIYTKKDLKQGTYQEPEREKKDSNPMFSEEAPW